MSIWMMKWSMILERAGLLLFDESEYTTALSRDGIVLGWTEISGYCNA